MLVIRNLDNSIHTNWYCKPINSNRILNFFSNHSKSMRLNTAKSFAKRVILLSHPKFHKENYLTIWKILKKNNYPSHLIKRIIGEVKHINFNSTRNPIPPINGTNTTIYKAMTYIKNLSKGAKRKFQVINNLKLAFKPNLTLGSIYTNTKDKFQRKEISNIVYKVTCTDCNNVYIGQTSKKLDTRLKQHQQYINSRTPRSALASHALDNSHCFDFSSASVIDYENHRKKRETLEALHIFTTNNTVNLRTDTFTINNSYSVLLQK